MGGMIQKKIHIVNIEATETLALKLASVITKGDVITFKGNLGAGKTTLIKALIKNLANKNIEVTSPTFNLLHLYETTRNKSRKYIQTIPSWTRRNGNCKRRHKTLVVQYAWQGRPIFKNWRS